MYIPVQGVFILKIEPPVGNNMNIIGIFLALILLKSVLLALLAIAEIVNKL